jgi:hypothetical protein
MMKYLFATASFIGALLICSTRAGAQVSQQTLSGASPSIACAGGNDIHAIESLTANTNVTLPASATGCNDGQVIDAYFTQGSGSYTVAFTAGLGTSIAITVPGGSSPVMPAGSSNTALYQFKYDLAHTTWNEFYAGQNPTLAAIYRATSVQGTLTWSGFLGETTTSAIAPAVMPNAGHFTRLACVCTFTGTCTTIPEFNIKDVTASTIGTATSGLSTTVGTVVSESETLAFSAGDEVAINTSSAGATCTAPQWFCSATYTQP